MERIKSMFEKNKELMLEKDENSEYFYTAKFCDPKIMKGDVLNDFLEISFANFLLIKSMSQKMKEKKYNGSKHKDAVMKKIYYDWEAVKDYFRLLPMKTQKNKIGFAMNLESISFCEFEFGQLSNGLILSIAKFKTGGFTEKELDQRFHLFLWEKKRKNNE